MNSEYERFEFDSPNGIAQPGRTAMILGKYLGMPVGAEIADRWYLRKWDAGDPIGQEQFVNAPAMPDETMAGTEWVHTQVTGSTVTVVDTGFPAYLRILTGAGDGQGQQMQAIKGATGNTKLMFDTSTMDEMFFSIMFRLVDANNNLATVQQSKLFFGFAPVDTSILTAVDDYMGFVKDDASGLIKLVADQTSGAPVSGASSSADVMTLAAAQANKWITLTFRASKLNRTTQKGVAYGFVDLHSQPAGASKRIATHRATLNLGANSDVPGAAMAPSIAFLAGEATAKNLDIAYIIAGGAYRLGV